MLIGVGSDATPSTLLVTITDGVTTAPTADRVRDLGHTVQRTAQYAASATSPDAAVSAVLGVNAGLLPGQVLVVDLTTYVFLSVGVATAVGATNAAAAWAVRRATG